MVKPKRAWRLLLGLAILPTLAAQSSADIAKGKQLFLGMCSRCHGAEGGGGEGPNLNKPVLTRAADDEALRAIITTGIPDRGMPRTRRLTVNELNSIAAYVRSLGRTGQAAVHGNRENGRVLYQKFGCSSCHVIGGQGGTLGPELTNIGARRSVDYLRQSIVEPAAALPRGSSEVPGRGFNEFLPVRVVTRDGREVTGVRVNEDSFTIQLRDASSRIYSFQKADLQSLDKQFGTSLMPEYKTKASAPEVDDLVAYLATLGGAK